MGKKTNIEKFLELVSDKPSKMMDIVNRKVTLELRVAPAIELLNLLEEHIQAQGSVGSDALERIEKIVEILKDKLDNLNTTEELK